MKGGTSGGAACFLKKLIGGKDEKTDSIGRRLRKT